MKVRAASRSRSWARHGWRSGPGSCSARCFHGPRATSSASEQVAVRRARAGSEAARRKFQVETMRTPHMRYESRSRSVRARRQEYRVFGRQRLDRRADPVRRGRRSFPVRMHLFRERPSRLPYELSDWSGAAPCSNVGRMILTHVGREVLEKQRQAQNRNRARRPQDSGLARALSDDVQREGLEGLMDVGHRFHHHLIHSRPAENSRADCKIRRFREKISYLLIARAKMRAIAT